MQDPSGQQTSASSRFALLGFGDLTASDADALQRSRESRGWIGRPSVGRSAVLIGVGLFWAALLVIGLARGVALGRLWAPLLFVIVGVLTALLGVIRRHKIKKALGRSD